jgi:FkbM family methyltransferase
MRALDAVERCARALGVLIVPLWRASQLDEERHISRLLEFLDIDCVFDAGANTGQHAKKLRRYCGYKGLILSFEPNPACFPALRESASKDSLWHVFPFALGEERGRGEFHAYDDSLLGSMLKFDPAAAGAPEVMPYKTIAIEVDTIANVFPQLQQKFGFARPFLKLDTQGSDLKVAMGAGDVLRQFLGIQSEVAFDPIYQGAPKFEDVIGYYETKGFRMSRLFANNDVHFPRLVEMDVVLVRTDRLEPSSREG